MTDRPTSLDGGGHLRSPEDRRRTPSRMNRFSLPVRPHSRQKDQDGHAESKTKRKRMSLFDRALVLARPLLMQKPQQLTNSVEAMLQPGQYGFVYYPGDQVNGAILISHPRTDVRVHSMHVRVQGIAKVPRMIYDDISGQDRASTLNWTFYDTDIAAKSSSYIVTVGDEWRHKTKHDSDTQVPYSFQLPTFCQYRSYDGFFGKRLVQMPPSMLISVTMDEQHAPARPRSKMQAKASRTLPPLVLKASVQYFVTVKTMWHTKLGIRKQTIKRRLPFIVHRRPVSSSLIGHNTGSSANDSRRLDGMCAPPGMPSSAHSRGSSASVAGTSSARQAFTFASADAFIARRSVRRDLVLLETPRGPEAWHVFHKCMSLGRDDDEIRIEFSFLGTATISVDKPVPFTIKADHAQYKVDPDSVRLDLLRSTTLHSSFGDVLLRSGSPIKNADGHPIVDISSIRSWDGCQSQQAPTDEYASQVPVHTDAKVEQGVRGVMTIKGRWDALNGKLEKASRTSSTEPQCKAKGECKTHPIFLGDEEVICSSFTFGNFQLQHALRLTLSLVPKGATEAAKDTLTLELDAPIQLEVNHPSHCALRNQRFSLSPDGRVQDRNTSLYDAFRLSVSQRCSEDYPSRLPRSSSFDLRNVLRRGIPSTETDLEHTPVASTSSVEVIHRNQSTSSITPLMPRIEQDPQGWDDDEESRPAALAHAMSIATLRTIDGPSPSYFESLQARLSSP